jgi:hypothetical protein
MIGLPSEDPAADRARWLGELAEALDEAREVLKQIGGTSSAEAAALELRIEAACAQVHAMRLRRIAGGGQVFGPEWAQNIPWRLSA